MTTLRGRIIAVTRDPGQAAGLGEALRARGAEPLACPTVAFAPPASWAEVDAALADWTRVDWVLFPSANAATFFLDRAAGRLGSREAWAGKRVGAVGEATRRLLEARGVPVDVVPARFTGAELAAELVAGQPVPEGVAVIPSSDIGREELAEALAAAGWTVRQVTAYRTVPAVPPAETLERLPRADAVTFASPSAVKGFAAVAGTDFFRRHPGVAAVSIGPSTTRALAALAPATVREASPHTAEGLVQALEALFAPPTA